MLQVVTLLVAASQHACICPSTLRWAILHAAPDYVAYFLPNFMTHMVRLDGFVLLLEVVGEALSTASGLSSLARVMQPAQLDDQGVHRNLWTSVLHRTLLLTGTAACLQLTLRQVDLVWRHCAPSCCQIPPDTVT
jgi:hypothetical protein